MSNISPSTRGLAVLATAGAIAISGGTLVGLASPALAATTDTSGSATEAVDSTFASQVCNAHIHVVVRKPGTSAVSNGQITATFPVSGGNATIVNFTGTLHFGGSLTFSTENKETTFSNLQLSYRTAKISGTAPDGTQLALADLGGVISHHIDGNTETLSSTKLLIDSAGASYLDGALSTSFFTGGQDTGSFSTTYTTSTS